MDGPADGCHPIRSTEATEASNPRIGTERPRTWFLVLVTALSAVLVAASGIGYLTVRRPAEGPLEAGSTVYFNEACGDCVVYRNEELLPTLAAANATPVRVKDYIDDRSYRGELAALNDALGIPFDLQSHLATFVVGPSLVVLEGHVPAALIEQSLESDPTGTIPKLLVYQDTMGVAEAYRAWGFAGAPRTFPITTPLDVYRAWYAANIGLPPERLPSDALFPLVLAAGLMDGLNLCAFAVLLFFVSFLYAVRAPRREVWRMGSLYAYAVFLVYFLIGLGLLRAIVVSEDPHLIAKVAAIVVIVLGGVTLLRIAFPRVPLPVPSHIPSAAWLRIKERILEGSAPSATVAGLLVGLCTFPCSGGIYVAILGLLAANTTFLEGLAYLYAYNVMYILPLVAVLASVSNRRVALKVAQWERAHAGRIRAALAAGMVAVGAALLVISL